VHQGRPEARQAPPAAKAGGPSTADSGGAPAYVGPIKKRLVQVPKAIRPCTIALRPEPPPRRLLNLAGDRRADHWNATSAPGFMIADTALA
jgi:hypothetical protein